MKILLLALIPLALSLPTVWAQSAAPEPAKLGELRKSYQGAISRATAPITKTYLAELDRLKTDLTKKGDLQGALAVEAEIKMHSSASDEASIPADDLIKTVAGTKWKNRDKAAKERIEFDEGKVFFVDPAGGRRGYTLNADGHLRARFKYGSGQMVTITFDRRLSTFEISAPKGTFVRE